MSLDSPHVQYWLAKEREAAAQKRVPSPYELEQARLEAERKERVRIIGEREKWIAQTLKDRADFTIGLARQIGSLAFDRGIEHNIAIGRRALGIGKFVAEYSGWILKEKSDSEGLTRGRVRRLRTEGFFLMNEGTICQYKFLGDMPAHGWHHPRRNVVVGHTEKTYDHAFGWGFYGGGEDASEERTRRVQVLESEFFGSVSMHDEYPLSMGYGLASKPGLEEWGAKLWEKPNQYEKMLMSFAGNKGLIPVR